MQQPTKLFNRNYFLLWQGQAISKLGSQVFSIALIFWITEVTGSPMLMGLLSMTASIPALLLGPVGGAFADRYSRRMIIIFCDLLNGLAMLSLAGLVYYFPNQTDLTVVWLFMVTIFVAIVNSFFFPSISASIPDLVPRDKLVKANTMTQLSLRISVLFGQGLGGIFYKLLGPYVIFIVNGLSFFFSAGSESFIKIPQKIAKKDPQMKNRFQEFKTDIVEGFRYIWHKSGLRELLMVSTLLNFFVTPIIILMPFFVKDFLNLGENWNMWFGFLIAVYSVGTMFGFVFAGIAKLSAKSRGRLMVVILIVKSVIYGAIGLSGNILVVMGLAAIGGFMTGFVTVNITTILQLTTPSEIRGRVFGLLGTLSGAVAPLAMGLSGIVADLLNKNYPLVYIFCGGSMVFITSLVTFNKNYRDYLAYDPVDDKEAGNVPIDPSELIINPNESLA